MTRRFVAPVIGVVVFLLAWEGFVRWRHVPAFELRAPSKIVRYIAKFPRDYLDAAWVTIQHAGIGLAIALVLSIGLGALLTASPFAEHAVQPVLTLVQVTPFVVYISSVVLWLGSGTKPAIFMVALVCLPPFTFAAIDGMRSAEPAARELLASVDASRWEVLWRLRLPSAMPALFTTARFLVGLSLVAAYLVEGANFANEGLGALGSKASAFNQGDAVWAVVFVMAVLGSLALILLSIAQRLALHWHASQRGLRRAGVTRYRAQRG